MSGAIWRRLPASKAVLFSFVAFVFLLSGGAAVMNAQAFSENFDTVNSNDPMPLPNWVAINNSSPVGPSLWFQGNPTVFTSQSGASNSYIGANFQNTGDSGDISSWLLTPVRTFHNGDVIRFYTRTATGSLYPDRLQVRLSTAGASTDVGTTTTSVGDFTTLLLEINPDLQQGGYPDIWTLETITLSGLTGTPTGRIAFRYFVTDGGTTGVNSNYIGIDTFSFTSGTVTPRAHQESDYNGDGKTDFSTIRNVGGGASGQTRWITHINGVSAPDTYFDWGIASDVFLPNDYDGDNKTDYAVWRPGDQTFYIFYSMTSTFSGPLQFGAPGDDASVVADYDGDGKTDIATYGSRANVPICAAPQKCFFYRGTLNNPSANITYVPWGQTGDFPVPGDYDGDAHADFVVQRAAGDGFAIFWIRSGATGAVDHFEWGLPSDFVVPGDYDGDGSTDIATVRGSGGNFLWYIRSSSAPTIYNYYSPSAYFGNSLTDFLVQGDYDGDGRTDIAIWRPNADPTMNYFYWVGSTSGFTAYPWGLDGDYPGANWNTH